MLVKVGMRTVQMIGVPTRPLPQDVDAAVIALKSRSSPVAEAASDSLAALRWLESAGYRQVLLQSTDTKGQGVLGAIRSTPRRTHYNEASSLASSLPEVNWEARYSRTLDDPSRSCFSR
ncbi:MAG: hypothetical protein JNK68_09030 [Betaproteobacteria bacterium]|nr:hypothetical protein [Betaproteobacteria bacterium]